MGQNQEPEKLCRRGDVINSCYVLGDVLGAGGMGVVYSATQRSLERMVALKLPRPELAIDPLLLKRFRSEALAGSRVSHRNIVRVLDFGTDRGSPYLVMEHVVGPTLGQYLQGSRLPHATVVELVREIVAGLEDAHANGIVHADIKCENVLIETRRNGHLTPRLIDFGIARFVDEYSGSLHMFSGTPEYVAPEVIRGELPGFAADVYGIGVMLYEMLAGVTPFSGDTSAEIMTRKLEDDAISLSWRYPDHGICVELDDLVTRALARDPAARFPDAAALGRALDALPLLPTMAPGAELPTVSPETTTETMSVDAGPEVDRSRACRREAPMRPTLDRGFPLRVSVARAPTELACEHGSPLACNRSALASAVSARDGDAIAVGYLELARVLVEQRELALAIRGLEEGIAQLKSAGKCGPVWRLLLTVAALYDGTGDRKRARAAARTAVEVALSEGSSVGHARASRLCARLGQRAPMRPQSDAVE